MVLESRSDVFEVLRENGSRLRSVGVEKIGVFGSFSRGEQDSSSDVDLLLVFRDGEKGFRNLMDARKDIREVNFEELEKLIPKKDQERNSNRSERKTFST
jgi:predicted nucleotidyltransferase